MNKDIVHMPDPREEALIRQALTALVQDEMDQAEADDTLAAEYRRTLPAVQKHIEAACAPKDEQKPRRTARRSLRAALLIAAVLVAFSGVCLASPEIRENLFAMVQNTYGGYTRLHVQHSGEKLEDSADLITVDPDDPRLAYVHPDWCLHYYPLEMPQYGTVRLTYDMPTVETGYTVIDEWGNKIDWYGEFSYMTDEQRERELKSDYQMITFKFDDRYYEFVEDGSGYSRYDVDTERDSMTMQTIDGKEVYVIERSGGDTTFVWQEGDHMLTLTSNDIHRHRMEYIFSTIERIR